MIWINEKNNIYHNLCQRKLQLVNVYKCTTLKKKIKKYFLVLCRIKKYFLVLTGFIFKEKNASCYNL